MSDEVQSAVYEERLRCAAIVIEAIKNHPGWSNAEDVGYIKKEILKKIVGGE